MMTQYGWGNWGYSPFPLSTIFWVLFWLLVLFLIIRIFSRKDYHSHRYEGPSRALEILRERYARGEINKQEFEEKKKDLSI